MVDEEGIVWVCVCVCVCVGGGWMRKVLCVCVWCVCCDRKLIHVQYMSCVYRISFSWRSLTSHILVPTQHNVQIVTDQHNNVLSSTSVHAGRVYVTIILHLCAHR